MLTHTYKARQLVTRQLVKEWKKQPALFFGEATHGLIGVVGGRHGVIPLASQNFSMLLFMCVMMPTCQCQQPQQQSTAGWNFWSPGDPSDSHPAILVFDHRVAGKTNNIRFTSVLGLKHFQALPLFFRIHFECAPIWDSSSCVTAVPGQWPRARQSMEASPYRMEVQWKLYWNVMKCAVKFRKKFGKFRIPEKNCLGGLWSWEALDTLDRASEAPAGRGSCWTIDADIVGVCLAHSKIDQQQKQNGTKRLTRIVFSNL